MRSEVINPTQTAASEGRSPDLQQGAAELRTKVETYLCDTNKEELNLEGIQRDLKALFDDLDSLSETLHDRVELVKTSVLEAPRQVTEQAKAQYEKTTTALAEYLRNTNLEELDPEGIKKDLQTLLDDPKAGADALRDRLSQVDRDTLVKLLTQQGNLTEEQVNATIEYLIDRYGAGKLAPPIDTPERVRYIYWLHYAEGSLMPLFVMSLVFDQLAKRSPFLVRPIVVAIAQQAKSSFITPQIIIHLNYLESELELHDWFTSKEFSAADIQMSFPLEQAAKRAGLDVSRPHLVDFLERIHARPAYQRALERSTSKVEK